MKVEEIYVQNIYNQVRNIVEKYNQKLNRQLEPDIPKNKKRAVRKVKHGRYFIRMFQKDIPDAFFIKYFNLLGFDKEIEQEIDKYVSLLHIDYEIGCIDIMDLVSNPKTNGMTYIESLNRLYDRSDSINSSERTFDKHMESLVEYWCNYNNGKMCLWDSCFNKIGTKFYISNFNGSHLTCLCKLIAISGLSDADLSMPSGFIQSFSSITTQYRNTPDDLEFVFMFNRMYEIIKQVDPKINFYLKNAETKGINVIGIEGTDIEISNVQELMEYMKTQSFLIPKSENDSQDKKVIDRYDRQPDNR